VTCIRVNINEALQVQEDDDILRAPKPPRTDILVRC